ncbi:hypothetical protein [Vibrio sp. MA40-2]|uniref:hypothetical protein n=1 Tax=Vibrio sp. MA40-2 TaxID=3391828 RepID=UPI0039A46F78
MPVDDLDEMMSDDFLNAIDVGVSINTEPCNTDRPSWVCDDTNHTTFKAWDAIVKLKLEKEDSIKSFGRVADKKTLKGLYQIKKSEVAALVGISSQSIFRTSNFSEGILMFFDEMNVELLEVHRKEQKKQELRYRKSGVRVKKKDELVDDIQSLRKRVQELEAINVKETLDLLLREMPIDLRRKLRM